jgi:hypothetical protein
MTNNNFSTFADKINKFFKVIVLPLIITNFIAYLIGSFIAMDFNINNWWAYTSTFGRILLSFFELMILLNITKWYSQYNNE